MNLGDKFPNIYVAFFKKRYYLVDGRHRLEAYIDNGEEFVQCDVKVNFPSFDDIFLASVRANLNHGHRLNKKDKVKIKIIMIGMNFKAEDISKLTGINLEAVENSISGNIQNKYINVKVRQKKIPSILEDKPKQEEEISIIDEKQTKDDWHYAQLKEVLEFFTKEKFDTKDKEVKKLMNKIKTKIKKWKI